jgi:hypothetical protein
MFCATGHGIIPPVFCRTTSACPTGSLCATSFCEAVC